ncbi:MAG TPA: heparin lyase I family protein [Candidatus Methylacidiphilales bacterium]|nr:heparin lyase I family protein [Candidatus Methylacidiphilales bacterium]
MKPYPCLLSVLLLFGAAALPSHATVYFQNEGDNKTWPNYPQDPEAKGTIGDVTSPLYKDSTSIEFTQTFEKNYTGRYHSEVDVQDIQENNQDRYYGEAVYVDSNWQNADDQVNFQQWAGSGPWILMRIDGSDILLVGPMGEPHLQAMPHGAWTRVVTRIYSHGSTGIFTVWINGTQKYTKTNSNFQAPGSTNGAIRWSTGCYVSGWYQQSSPQGPSERITYGDHYRVADSQSEADPANW